jgi:sugar phosphate isomerase/epimerase
MARIGLMCGGVGGRIRPTWDRSQPVVPQQLDAIMDVPEFLADKWGIHNLDIQSIYILSMDPSYLARFNERLKKAKCKVTNMPLELDDDANKWSGIIGPSATDPAIRAKAIGLTRQWIDVAPMIGCPSVMLNQGRNFAENFNSFVETLKIMGAYGRTKNVTVTMENRGGGTPEQLADAIKSAGAGVRAMPDLGNFPDEETRTRGMGLLVPLALNQCHVKMRRERFDFGRSIRLAEELGFKGVYSIEGGYNNLPQFIEELTANMA